MFYVPDLKIFQPEEFFPPHIIKNHTDKNGRINGIIWRLMDSRIVYTAVELRNLFGPMTINNYKWGGQLKNRGFRDPISLIDQEHFKQTGEIIAEWSSFTSQHCRGAAVDSSFKNELAQDVRKYIIHNKGKWIFRYIKAIEKEVSWLHFDSRNFQIGNEKIFLF